MGHSLRLFERWGMILMKNHPRQTVNLGWMEAHIYLNTGGPTITETSMSFDKLILKQTMTMPTPLA